MISISHNSIGGGCDVEFIDLSDNYTNILFVGEPNIAMRVYFYEDCTNLNVELNNTLFKDKLSGITPIEIQNGSIIDHYLDIDLNAPPGNYTVEISISYLDNKAIEKRYNFRKNMKYMQAIDFITYVDLTDIKIIIETTDIDIEEDEFIFQPCRIGQYHVDTYVYKTKSSRDIPILTYKIIGHYKSRPIYYSRNNIELENIEIQPIVNSKEESEKKNYNIWIALLLLLLIFINMMLYIFKRRNLF